MLRNDPKRKKRKFDEEYRGIDERGFEVGVSQTETF